ncbi:scavenger receptor class F member 1 [Elgaria multicarinata webbii]|uniref:scavenger receptor class F member 1 n=1 Tax=Elgaria multicarinata webbii TaxID=159646 RepID=UPI002FCCDD1A
MTTCLKVDWKLFMTGSLASDRLVEAQNLHTHGEVSLWMDSKRKNLWIPVMQSVVRVLVMIQALENPRRKRGRPSARGRATECRAAAAWATPDQGPTGTMDLLPLLLLLGCRGSSDTEALRRPNSWRPEGQAHPAGPCTGGGTCGADEVCVWPGICRCKPGFFGANCTGRCPGQFWGPDCKERCLCDPHGTCDPASGACSCLPGRWGPLCQLACPCDPRSSSSSCDPLTGACRCRVGWWAPDCRRQCLCNLAGSRCDPGTGQCACHRGWWGKRCAFACSCNGAPCAQESGRCECGPGLWGVACHNPCRCLHGTCAPQDGRCSCHTGYQGESCAEPCPAGRYGPYCAHSCGHCKDQPSCSPVNGSCPACAPGWSGTHCQQPCPPGRHGENCSQPCPRCRHGETCSPETGECRDCEAGLRGTRCELTCPPGLFGDGCQLLCPDCFNGSCDPASGACKCQAGYWGPSCNRTCPEGFHGPNCSEACWCMGALCHPVSGVCRQPTSGSPPGQHPDPTATPAVPWLLLLLLLLLLLQQQGDCPQGLRAAVVQGNSVTRMKHRVLGTLADLRSALPCFSLGGYKFPGITVSHHDAEIPFNPSFIEPPSAAWPSDSSFNTDEEEEEAGLACPLPDSEAPDTELQMGFLPEVSALNPEPFAIPRTSSMAKTKRPSVSFAEGTRFSPQSPRSSAEALTPPTRKPKASRGSAAGDSPQLHTLGPEQESILPNTLASSYENVEAGSQEEEEGGRPRALERSTPAGRRKRMASSRHVAQRVEVLEAATKGHSHQPSSLTTIYVTVGKAGRGSSEGPVQAILHRLGSLQRAQPVSKEEPWQWRSLEGLQKPPWRMPGAQKDSKRLVALDRAGLETPESGPGEAEAQGLLEGLPAPMQEEEKDGEHSGGSSSPESCPSLSQPEAATGGLASEEGQEPTYENVSSWSSYP